MHNSVLPRQLCALCFCAFTVPAIMLLPRAGWLWAGAACAVAAILFAWMAVLRRRCASDLAAITCFAWGGFGRILLALTLLWTLLLLGAAARTLCGAYPSGNSEPLVGLMLLLLASYAASKGSAVVARAGAISFFFLIFIYGFVLAFSGAQMHTQWLRPATEGLPWGLMTTVLSPVCGFYLCGRMRGKGNLRWWLLGGVLLAVGAALCTAGTLSPQIAREDSFAFYTMTKSISLFGTMERFEAVVSAAVTAGGFCLLSLLCLANERILEVLEIPFPAGVLNFIAGSAALWISKAIPENAVALGTAIFWGILPALTLFVGSKKKV